MPVYYHDGLPKKRFQDWLLCGARAILAFTRLSVLGTGTIRSICGRRRLRVATRCCPRGRKARVVGLGSVGLSGVGVDPARPDQGIEARHAIGNRPRPVREGSRPFVPVATRLSPCGRAIIKPGRLDSRLQTRRRVRSWLGRTLSEPILTSVADVHSWGQRALVMGLKVRRRLESRQLLTLRRRSLIINIRGPLQAAGCRINSGRSLVRGLQPRCWQPII